MRVLYINSHSADYVQDLTYSGLVKVLGLKSVVDYHWNKKYHIHYKKYPKDLGYTKGSFFPSIFNRNIKDVDAVILGASKVDCFETYIEIVDEISPGIPIIFVDGGDQSEIGKDLTIYERPELFEQAVSKRPFDFIFKREYLLEIKHENNVYPFPMSYNLDRMPGPLEGKKYDVSFWAVESYPIRTQALKLLEDKFDCKRNGTETNQQFSQYKRKGLFYLQELAQCKIVLNFRGGGWDTIRYWEVPAMSTFMISQKSQIFIPNNFVDKESIVFCKDDLRILWTCVHII